MAENYYRMCQQHIGKCVVITEHNGRRHYGRITRVDNKHVYLQPLGNRGFGYGWGWGWGWGYPVALGAIAGLALAGLFFW